MEPFTKEKKHFSLLANKKITLPPLVSWQTDGQIDNLNYIIDLLLITFVKLNYPKVTKTTPYDLACNIMSNIWSTFYKRKILSKYLLNMFLKILRK